jgi:hypothetical protein
MRTGDRRVSARDLTGQWGGWTHFSSSESWRDRYGSSTPF